MTTKDRHFVIDRKNNRERITIEVRKGKRDKYKQAAHELNLSLSMLIQMAVEEFIQNHGGTIGQEKFPQVSPR